MVITFSVQGTPVPQPRARVSTIGGFARAYTPAGHAVHGYRRSIAHAAADAGLRVLTGPLEVVIDAVFERPKSHFLKSGLKPSAPEDPLPDVDNLAKSALDSLHEFFNDRQVRRLVVEKSYGTEARTTIRITQVPAGCPPANAR